MRKLIQSPIIMEMRYYLSLLLTLGLLSQPIEVPALQQNSPNIIPSRDSSDFWPRAEELVREQLDLTDRIETTIVSADPDRLKSIRAQLFLHAISVDRLLKDYYPSPNLLCIPTPNNTFEDFPAIGSLSAEQARVYCILYSSTQKLESLRPAIDRSIAAIEPLSPTTTLSSDLPLANPPLIGTIAKQPIADYAPPISPAIATPVRATTSLSNIRSLLAQARRIFPPGTEFNIPKEVTSIDDNNPYTLFRTELEPHTQFLTLPNTGITRILSAEFYRQGSNISRNRLTPTIIDRFPYPPLIKTVDRFTPRLEIQLASDNFQIVQRELNYGFIMDLGDIPLEDIDATQLEFLTPAGQFFMNYRSPDKLEALQVDRRRFITGKQQNFGLDGVIFAEATAVLNRTYLVRTIQFQLPEIVLSGDRISRSQRRNLNSLLQTPSADLLIAFRPVYRRSDGSYTVLWRVLKQFPDPQIRDLEKYLDFE